MERAAKRNEEQLQWDEELEESKANNLWFY